LWYFSRRHLKPYERFYIPNYDVYRTYRHPRLKDETAIAVRKCIPHTHVSPSPLLSTEVNIDWKKEVLLAALYKPPGRNWSDADVIGILNFTSKSLLVGDLNAKNAVWDSQFSALGYETVGPTR
jgi:hypothetical protein